MKIEVYRTGLGIQEMTGGEYGRWKTGIGKLLTDQIVLYLYMFSKKSVFFKKCCLLFESLSQFDLEVRERHNSMPYKNPDGIIIETRGNVQLTSSYFP